MQHAQVSELQNSVITFLHSAVSQMPVAVTIGICLFFFPFERYRKIIGIEI